MDKTALRVALDMIWACVLRATEVQCLDPAQIEALREAVGGLAENWPVEDSFRGQVEYLRDLVRLSGVISVPYRPPTRTQEILMRCQELRGYLDSDESGSAS